MSTEPIKIVHAPDEYCIICARVHHYVTADQMSLSDWDRLYNKMLAERTAYLSARPVDAVLEV